MTPEDLTEDRRFIGLRADKDPQDVVKESPP